MIRNTKLATLFALIIVAVSVSFGTLTLHMPLTVYFLISTPTMFFLTMFFTMVYVRKTKVKLWVSETILYSIFLFALAVIADYVVLIRFAPADVITIPILGHYLIFIPACVLGGWIAKRF